MQERSDFMKKFIAVILAVLMVTAALPMSLTAFAADEAYEQSGAGVSLADTAESEPVTTEPATTEPATTQPSTTEPATTEPAPVVYTPERVTNFKADNVKGKSLRLSWSKSKYATKYIIYRSVENNKGKTTAFKEYKSFDASVLKIPEYDLIPGRIYKYRIVAVREGKGYVTKSTASSTFALTRPAEIKKVKLSDRTETSVKVKWTKVQLATNYLVFRAAENGKFKLIKTFKGVRDAFTDTKLTNGTVYKYKVVAKRTRAGVSRVNGGTVAQTITKSSAPDDFSVKSATSGSVSLDWDKVARASQYQLYRKSGGSSFSLVKALKSTEYTDKNVSPSTDYTYAVRALRKYGGKTYFSPFKYVEAATASSAISGIQSKSALGHAILTWGGVSGASGYEVRVQKKDGSYKALATVASPSFISSKLTPGQTYKFEVCSFRVVGGSRVYGNSRKTKVTINATAYGNKPSGTWVEVCTEAQTLIMYVNNKFYLSTPVVTGNYGALATTPGYHHVMSKQSPSQLKGSYGGSSWDVTVNYWLGFTGDGQGIHDSTWRGAYGGEIYKGDGSHGCVNTPLDKMAQIYAKGYVGMPVIVF